MQLNVIRKPQVINSLCEYLKDYTYIAYDCETTGLHHTSEIIGFSVCASEDRADYVILAAWNAETKQLDYYPENLAASLKLIEILKTKQLIMHNATYDCIMAESYFKIRLIDSLHTCTMTLAHLLNENRRIGLKELAKAYFGADAADEAAEMKASVIANGGVLTKAVYEMFKCDPQIMGKYGAKDALLTYKLFLTLVPELYEQKLEDFFYELESMPLLRTATYDLNSTGLKIDMQKLTELKKQLEAEVLTAKHYINQETNAHTKAKYPGTSKKNVFNIGSNAQLSWLLFGQLNLEFSTLTKEGKVACKALGLKLPYTFVQKRNFIDICLRDAGRVYQPAVKGLLKNTRDKKIKEPWGYITVDKDTLKKLAHKYKWIEILLEMQKKQKLLGTYIKGIEERVKYGIIHPSFLQTGTSSGRYSSRAPNWQNLPRDDKRIKELVIARPGKVFVGADYSQLEPRVFAYYSKDPGLMAAFDGTTDFYSVVGMRVHDKTDCTPQKDGSPDAFGIKYKSLRDSAKTITLATAYGATAWQLMKSTGKSEQDTQQDVDNYLEAFPGVKTMMLEAHVLAKKHGQVVSLFGRPRRMPDAKKIDKIYGRVDHADLPYEARSMLNLACNHRIQSSGASIVNRAMIQAYYDFKAWCIDCRIVCQVHDSVIVECDEQDAENVSILLQNALETTTLLEGVPLEAVPKVGINFAQV